MNDHPQGQAMIHVKLGWLEFQLSGDGCLGLGLGTAFVLIFVALIIGSVLNGKAL